MHRWVIRSLLILLIWVATACGGAAVPVSNLAPTSTAGRMDATSSRPTSASTTTPAPTSTPIPATATSANLVTPSANPPRTVVPTSVDQKGQTACDHRYLPFRPGATWTYAQDDGSTFTWTVLSVNGDTTKAQAQVKETFSDQKFQPVTVIVPCSAATGIGFGLFSLPPQEGNDITIETLAYAGTFLPPVRLLKQGYTWKETITNQEMDKGGYTLLHTTNQYKVVGFELHEMADLHISQSLSTDVEDHRPNSPGNVNYTSTSDIFLAPLIGITEWDTTDENGKTTVKLVDFKIP